MSDPILKNLISLVNKYEFSVGVTLVVSGGVIAGTLVSAKSFTDGFAESFSAGWPGGPNENIRDAFAGWGQPGSESVHEGFVHLKDARYVFGNNLAPNGAEGILWRGSLDSVNGFSLGALTQS